MIELQDVGYAADGRPILDQINWTIEPRQHWAVLGPNGSGKTTLLRIATGYLWPHSGVVRRLGREMIDLGTLRRSIGWITSELISLIPSGERAKDTVVSGRFAQIGFKNLPWFQPTPADQEEASKQLELLGIADLAERRFGVLSQGEKQKVLIARARMADPLLLVLDEPCAGMDPGARETMLESLARLLREPDAPATVLVTHHVEEIIPAFSNTIILSRGRIHDQGNTRRVVTIDTLARVYGVKVAQLVESEGRLWPIWG